MNKLISTFICGAFALVSVSAQDVAPKFFKLKDASGGYLVLLKGASSDSTVVTTDAALIDSNFALWEVTKSDRMVSGNYAYQFNNKGVGALHVDGQVAFAVGTYENVLHELDTVGGLSAVEKTLFYAKNNDGVSLKSDPANNNVINTVAGTEIEVILEIPAKRWLTTVDLNENTEYTFDFLSQFEETDSTFLFEAVKDNVNDIFTIKSSASGKYFSVDSANWTQNSSVNILNQQPAFGFKLGFNKSPFKNFGVYYDPATDKVAIAVRDSSLGWDVTEREIGPSVVANPAAFVGYATFVSDSVVTTVDANTFALPELPQPENGIVFWVDAPQKGAAIATPFGQNPYVLTVVSADAAKNGQIYAIKYVDLNQNASSVYLPNNTSTVEPENQWYIKEEVVDGRFYYDVVNRYYGNVLVEDARVTAVNGGFIFGSHSDTLKVTEVENPAGFRVFSDYEMAVQKIKLNIVNSLGAESAALVLNDTLVVAGDNDGIAFNVKIADGFAPQDSFPYVTSPEDILNANDVYGVYTLYTLSGADTLFLGFDNADERLVLAKNPIKSAFVFKSDTEEAFKLLPIYSELAGDSTLRVHENGAFTEKIDYHNVLASLFKVNNTDSEYEYATLPAGHYTFKDASVTSTGLDYLTMREDGEAKFLRVGDELRAASVASDFALWVSSAYVPTSGVESLTPSYYIVTRIAEHIANGDSIRGNFLSVSGEFDGLNDSINFVNDEKGLKVNGTKDQLNTKRAFLFRITETENIYEIVPFEEITKAEARRLALINGVVVSSSDKAALPVLVELATELPVANEELNVSNVKVVAGEGNVLILNAAGKSVLISNILGQIVANTVLASDNVAIAAPKGIVVVAVDGEDAVKAIVK